MDIISNIIIIPALILAIILHVLRIVYLFFKPKIFDRFKSISGIPDKYNLFLYYILTISVLAAAILYRLGVIEHFFLTQIAFIK